MLVEQYTTLSVGGIATQEPSVLLQSFVHPYRETSEGTLIEVALVPWLDIITQIKKRWESNLSNIIKTMGRDNRWSL